MTTNLKAYNERVQYGYKVTGGYYWAKVYRGNRLVDAHYSRDISEAETWVEEKYPTAIEIGD